MDGDVTVNPSLDLSMQLAGRLVIYFTQASSIRVKLHVNDGIWNGFQSPSSSVHFHRRTSPGRTLVKVRPDGSSTESWCICPNRLSFPANLGFHFIFSICHSLNGQTYGSTLHESGMLPKLYHLGLMRFLAGLVLPD